MDLPFSCCKRIVNMINVHYRRMNHSPIHLTHENTTDFYNRLEVQPPWTYIAAHHCKLTTALALKTQHLMEPAEPHPDVCTLSPAYPPCDMNAYVPPTPPLPQASLAYPECHRHIVQAGMLKNHLRRQHQVPCLPEDVFRPLRDSFEGRSIYRHCKHQFTMLYALKDHINKRACHAFDVAQATVQPIVARDELRMHIRHRSFMGLMLDQALCSELAAKCAFCNLQVHARAMIRHYTDSHLELVGPAKQQYDFVSGLSNLVSGKGQCPMYQCKSLDLWKHTCAIMYQLAAMSGHVMPLRTRPWSATVPSGPETLPIEPHPEPATKRAKIDGGEAEQLNATGHVPEDRPQAALHKCPTCHACFLSLNGLHTHHRWLMHRQWICLRLPRRVDLLVQTPSHIDFVPRQQKFRFPFKSMNVRCVLSILDARLLPAIFAQFIKLITPQLVPLSTKPGYVSWTIELHTLQSKLHHGFCP